MADTWDQISDLILYAAIAVIAVFAVLGLVQWVQRKSLKKVDRELLAAPVPLLCAAATYLIFDKFWVLNTRPNGSGEPSFPSSHVLLVATVFFVTALILPRYIKSKPALVTIDLLMLTLLILVCVGRVAANMHWLSDVIGALVFAAIFAAIYYLIIKKLTKGAKHA